MMIKAQNINDIDSRNNRIGKRAFNSGIRKLTDGQAIAMYKEFKKGTPYKPLLKKYGVCTGTFFNYMNRIKQGIIKPS